MRRVIRIVWNSVAVLSLAMAVVVGILWVRSKSHLGLLYIQPSTHFWCIAGSDDGTLSATIRFEPPELRPDIPKHIVEVSARYSTHVASAGIKSVRSGLMVAVPHWLAITLLSISPTVVFGRQLRLCFGTPTIGLCPTCGYDLRVSPERCPECGTKSWKELE